MKAPTQGGVWRRKFLESLTMHNNSARRLVRTQDLQATSGETTTAPGLPFYVSLVLNGRNQLNFRASGIPRWCCYWSYLPPQPWHVGKEEGKIKMRGEIYTRLSGKRRFYLHWSLFGRAGTCSACSPAHGVKFSHVAILLSRAWQLTPFSPSFTILFYLVSLTMVSEHALSGLVCLLPVSSLVMTSFLIFIADLLDTSWSPTGPCHFASLRMVKLNSDNFSWHLFKGSFICFSFTPSL